MTNGEQKTKTNVRKQQRNVERLLQRPAAEMPVCFLNIPARISQMWVLYLWIAQWRHGPLIPPPRTSHQTHNTEKQPSHQNLCHPLPHHITSRRLQATVVRRAGNKPLGSSELIRANTHPPSHLSETLWKAFEATLWFAYLQLNGVSLKCQPSTCRVTHMF